MLRSIVVFALVALVAGCPVKAPNYDYAKEPDPRNSEYVLGIGDDLSINVWENPGLNTEAKIRPDGTITMPLIGDLKAVGETPSSLKEMIKTKLAAFVKVEGSEITVAVRGANSYRFTINGEVTKPGVYNGDHFVTISEAIAMAGGFTRFAKRNRMTLRRRDPKTGTERDIPLAYDLLSSTRPDMDIVVLAGDALFVP